MTTTDDKPRRQKLVISFHRNISLFALLVLPLLISLGVWQLNRAQQKRDLQQQLAVQQTQPPVSVEAKTLDALADYRRVVAEGEFDNQHIWLLDNKQRRAQVGYEVVVPFALAGGGTLLINRGWLAAGQSRGDLPPVAAITGKVTLFGTLATPTEHPLLSAKSETSGWPKVITEIEAPEMSRQLGKQVLPRYVKLEEASPGAFITDWQPMNVTPERHTGYAVQWFAMAAALVIWFVFANTNLWQLWQRKASRR